MFKNYFDFRLNFPNYSELDVTQALNILTNKPTLDKEYSQNELINSANKQTLLLDWHKLCFWTGWSIRKVLYAFL